MMDLEAIRQANPLPEIAARLVSLRRAGSEWAACCPFHADRTPSFTIFDGGRRFHCFGCGASGDVLDFVQRAYGLGLADAARLLNAGTLPRVERSGAMQAKKDDSRPAALAIWKRASPATGTLAEAYLRWRGIQPPYPPSLRFLRLGCDGSAPLPCLIAAVQDVAGAVVGIQRSWLADDGQGKADLPNPKRSLGAIKGGAIRLGEAADGGWLAICEGPETGLSLAAMLGGPVWAAAGASFLSAMQFPASVRSIVIGADNDPAGRVAADKAAQAYAARGLAVRLIRPLDGFNDFNDELRGAGHDC
jgi:DNA primase